MGKETRDLRILVTGGQGFLGGALVEALVQLGFENVAATARRAAPELESLGVEVVRADLTDPESARTATKGRDLIFHTAAKAGVWGSESVYHEINVLATRYLLQGSAAHGVPYFVHTSSPSVTFQGESSVGETELAPYGREPYNAYCATKIQAEREVFGFPEGPRALALRPHLIYGPGDPHLLPRVFEAAEQNRLVRVGDGLNRVDVTHISDVVASHLAVIPRLEQDIWGESYFITSGKPIRLWSWLSHILHWKGLPPIRRSVPLTVAAKLGALLERIYRWRRWEQEPPLTEFSALQLGCDHTYSIEKARRLLGYNPQVDPYAPFLQQLEEDVEWTTRTFNEILS